MRSRHPPVSILFLVVVGAHAVCLIGTSCREPEGQSVAEAPARAAVQALPAPVTRAPPPRSSSGRIRELIWDYPDGPWGRTRVVVTVPRNASMQNRMPVLIALHGRGEALRGPEAGARGWPDDYGMLRAFERLLSPPLSAEDFGGMIDGERLRRWNRSLRERPYRGVIVVSPYLADELKPRHLLADASRYGAFLLETVLPRVSREAPALADPAATGIDGISLGGRASVLVGLIHPRRFGAVGGMQPAFGKKQVGQIAGLLVQARRENPTLRFRLLTSKQDVFLDVTNRLSAAIAQRGEPHRMDIVEGNHSYEFNRGPGVYEMLLYYDRVLRGEAWGL